MLIKKNMNQLDNFRLAEEKEDLKNCHKYHELKSNNCTIN